MPINCKATYKRAVIIKREHVLKGWPCLSKGSGGHLLNSALLLSFLHPTHTPHHRHHTKTSALSHRGIPRLYFLWRFQLGSIQQLLKIFLQAWTYWTLCLINSSAFWKIGDLSDTGFSVWRGSETEELDHSSSRYLPPTKRTGKRGDWCPATGPVTISVMALEGGGFWLWWG